MFESSLSKVLAGVGQALLMLLVTAGCGTSVKGPEPSGNAGGQAEYQEGRPKATLEVAKERGGKLVVSASAGVFSSPNDPHLYVAGGGRSYAIPVANGILTRDIQDPKNPIVEDLAKSWEISKDGKTYTFKFHQGVKFQNVAPVNGREFTSEDARYSLMRMMADPSVIVEKWRPRFQRATEFPKLTMDTPDKYTLVISLEQPHAPLLDSIAFQSSVILPREFVESFPEKIILEGMVGTGPFTPVEYKLQQLATYRKNPDYWKKDSQGGQLPYLDGVDVVEFADPQAAVAAFRSQQLDVFSPNKTNMDVLKKEMPSAKAFITTTTSNFLNFRINVKAKPFDDVRVRRAIHLAVDRQQFRDLIGEGITTISGPIGSRLYPDVANTADWLMSQPGYRQPKDQDIAEAKRLMKEAGYENGFTFEFLQSGAGDMGALLADQLKVLNITVKAQVQDYAGQVLPRATAGDFQMVTGPGVAVGTDVDSVLAPNFTTEGSRNYSRYSNLAFDDLVKKEQRALTIEERRKYAQEAEKLLLEEAPAIFFYSSVSAMLAQPWVHNANKGTVGSSELLMVENAWVGKH